MSDARAGQDTTPGTGESERLRPGRLLHLRLPAGADLVDGVAAAAAEHGIARAVVRGGPGSLMRACVQAGTDPVDVPGPAAEILTLVGDLRPGRPPDLHGAVGDPTGRVFAGRFLPGRNPVCITVELVVEEMLPEVQGT